jgi:ParB-like chromosome segregation protein Spo0J
MSHSTSYRPSVMDVGKLLAHPLNRKLYGDEPLDLGLLESVRNLGFIEPITIITMRSLDPAEHADGAGRTYVLSGHRRFLAAKQLGLKTIPVRWSDLDPNDVVAVERHLIESNRQRVKTPEQVGREVKELLRIESALAKQRMLAGQKIHPRANLPQGIVGKARDKAAEAVGMGGRTADKLIKIIDAVDSGDAKARALLDAVNDRKRSIDSAFQELKKSAVAA